LTAATGTRSITDNHPSFRSRLGTSLLRLCMPGSQQRIPNHENTGRKFHMSNLNAGCRSSYQQANRGSTCILLARQGVLMLVAHFDGEVIREDANLKGESGMALVGSCNLRQRADESCCRGGELRLYPARRAALEGVTTSEFAEYLAHGRRDFLQWRFAGEFDGFAEQMRFL
jgi:hypothetical protein